jgi:hypothetical protein
MNDRIRRLRCPMTPDSFGKQPISAPPWSLPRIAATLNNC